MIKKSPLRADNISSCIVIGRLACGTLAVGLFQMGSPALAQSKYRATDLSFPGNFGSQANAVDAASSAGSDRYSVYYIRKVPHYILHGVYWPAGGGAPVDLNPATATRSEVAAASGGRQAGSASMSTGGVEYGHAVVWAGSAASVRDLNTADLTGSSAFGISGDTVVGDGSGSSTGGYVHAILWNVALGTKVDLNGAKHQESVALAASGLQQVGLATDAFGASDHAMLWQGTAASGIDLNPRRFSTSRANGVNNGQQVGEGDTFFNSHALLWRGTAASVVDLTPPGFIYAGAMATNTARQVGWGTKSNYKYHALVWSGQAGGYVDLQSFLPVNLVQSYANAIDAAGNIAGYATDAAGVPHAILWQPLP